MKKLLFNHINDIKKNGLKVLIRKILFIIKQLFAIAPAFVFLIVIRLLKPILLIRIGSLISSRVGHFAMNTELYLCEMDEKINKPDRRYIDIFYFGGDISNKQLAKMWKRKLYILPSFFLFPIAYLNQVIPGGNNHIIRDNTAGARDIFNLFDKYPPHLHFNNNEVIKGEKFLRSMGIPQGAKYICLIVRDDEYLKNISQFDYSYHDYRDSNIENFLPALEELAKKNYYIIRMGAVVKNKIYSSYDTIIDYATNGMRNDYMDIYLGATCTFCISTATGWDDIPDIFRRPLVYINAVPLGLVPTGRKGDLFITKHHKKDMHFLKISEIFKSGLGMSMRTIEFNNKNTQLVEISPEEISDIVLEMEARLNGTWIPNPEDEILQEKFKSIFSKYAIEDYKGVPLHGEIRARYGANFLRNNQWWLD